MEKKHKTIIHWYFKTWAYFAKNWKQKLSISSNVMTFKCVKLFFIPVNNVNSSTINDSPFFIGIQHCRLLTKASHLVDQYHTVKYDLLELLVIIQNNEKVSQSGVCQRRRFELATFVPVVGKVFLTQHIWNGVCNTKTLIQTISYCNYRTQKCFLLTYSAAEMACHAVSFLVVHWIVSPPYP